MIDNVSGLTTGQPIYTLKPAGNEITRFCAAVTDRFDQLAAHYAEKIAGAKGKASADAIRYDHQSAARTLINRTHHAFDLHRATFTFDYGLLHQTGYARVYGHRSVDDMLECIFGACISNLEHRLGTARGNGIHYTQVFWRDLRAAVGDPQ